MTRIDVKDAVGGTILTLLGVFIISQAITYGIGTLGQMKAGFYPMLLGVGLTVVGLIIGLPALRRGGEPITIQWRPMVSVLAAIASFALSIAWLGLVPALFITIFIAGLGDRSSRWTHLALLGACVAIALWLIFVVWIGIPVAGFVGLI